MPTPDQPAAAQSAPNSDTDQAPAEDTFPQPTRPQPGELNFAAPRRKKPPRHIADLTMAERREVVEQLGEKAFRASQLSQNYFGRLVDDPADWTGIPWNSRDALYDGLFPKLLTPVKEMLADGGKTRKTLWRLFDGATVESVLMRYPDRATVCVSSQAGCGMNCPFCATGQAGLTRNMSTAEIVDQVISAARNMHDGTVPGGPGRLTNVVFMGMGEPLANYKSVVAAVRRLIEPAPDGLGLSQRQITMSTVGLVPAMIKFADEGFSCRLALSLHAPDDELRNELVPVNTRWDIREVLDAAWYYGERSGRRISIEYALIKDINDQAWRADLLGRRLKNHFAHVNLIPLNPTPGSKWTASTQERQDDFVRLLERHGVPVTVRDTRGREIDGACGQLAATNG